MDPQIFDIAAKTGLVGICLLTIYLGWKREERTASAFEDLNKRSNDLHGEYIKQLTELNANSRALHDEIRQRPCVVNDWNGNDRRGKHS